MFDGSKWISGKLSFWDVTWSGATAYTPDGPDQTGGTAYASMTDSASAINAAITKAKSLGVPVRGCGRFRIDSTVTIDCDADFTGAEFVCSSTSISPAVLIGSAASGTAIAGITVVAPQVINVAKTTSGWTGTSVGVSLSNLYHSVVTVPRSKYFVTGLLVTSTGVGCVYNEVHIGHLQNNKVNLSLTPSDTVGWVNENTFLGAGRLSHESGEGTGVSGVRQISCVTPTGGEVVNNNLFLRLSLEGNVPEYHVESIGASTNTWFHCRWEATTPKVNFADNADPTGSTDNVIWYGYNSFNIVVTQGTNAARNHLYTRNRMWLIGSGGNDGLIVAENVSGSDKPALTIVPAGSGLAADPESVYLTAISGNLWIGKAAGDTAPRIQIDTQNGRLQFGPGNAAVDAGIQRIGTAGVGTMSGDKFIATAGIGVGNSAAGSTPGTCVKKMEVFDGSGASLGFVPIYDAIT